MSKDKTTEVNEQTPFEAPAAEGTAMVSMDDDNSFVADLTKRVLAYCSFQPKTTADKAKLFNMINSPEQRLKSAVNKIIPVVHIYAEMVTCIKEETAEVQEAPRVVFMDDKGISYQCVSSGVFNATKKLMNIFGLPTTWTEPVKIMPKLIEKGKNNILTFDIVA